MRTQIPAFAVAVVSLFALASSGCPKTEPSVPVPAPTVVDAGAAPPPVAAATPEERAARAAAQLKGTVLAELQRALAAGGPAAAIPVCGEAAARARDALSAPDLAIGRTSSKLRNAANGAPGWVGAAITRYEQSAPAERRPTSLKQADGTLGYVEPIVVGPLCLQCHGAAIADDVKAALAARYPADRATGYAEGDLRGVVWVEIKPAATP